MQTLQFQPVNFDQRHLWGPFDIIGDIHGCYDEFVELLEKLGYYIEGDGETYFLTAPKGRKLILLGDLVDKGPKNSAVLNLVMSAAANGQVLMVPGNHDYKLFRYYSGRLNKVSPDLEETLVELRNDPTHSTANFLAFYNSLPSYLWLDFGNLIITHAGMKKHWLGLESFEIRNFCLYGDCGAAIEQNGLPIRRNWALRYAGKSKIVYGHTPFLVPRWINNTLNLDSGCVYGGSLSALRYPEMIVESVEAKNKYATARKPLANNHLAEIL